MAERGSKGIPAGLSKPISMKLFAIGDVGRIPPFCTSRICSCRLTHLVITRPLEHGLQSLTIAIKMQGSKRILRSTEIDIGVTGTLDTEIDLSLSLQYPHYLKQRTNLLYIMLQRRKKYKNRRILGYKTLAVGTLDMTEVLQHSLDQDLPLYTSPKEKDAVAARITIVSLSTQPVNSATGKESLEDENTSDEDEFTSEMSDSEGDAAAEEHLPHHEGTSKSRRKLQAGRQANFKQKFISLLRKFKASDGFDADVPELEGHEKVVLDDELLDELDFDSDSGPEYLDNISVQSAPRPHLSPYFKPGRSLSTLLVPAKYSDNRPVEKSDEGSKNNSDSHQETLTDEDGGALRSDDQKEDVKRKRMLVLREKSASLREKDIREKVERREKELIKESPKVEGRKFSHSIPNDASPKRAVMGQLDQMTPAQDEELPGSIILVNGNHALGPALQEHLQRIMTPVICPSSTGDLKACFVHLTSRLHKPQFGQSPNMLRVVVCGGDEFANAVLRSYVDLFTDRPPDFQVYLRFIFIPLGDSALAKYFSQVDSVFGEVFDPVTWHSALDHQDADNVDWEQIVEKIRLYCHAVTALHSVPIAQAMINVKSHGLPDAESSQMFIPFLNDVRISAVGPDSASTFSADPDDPISHVHYGPSTGPFSAAGGSVGDMQKADFSPPHSPSVAQAQTLPMYPLWTPPPSSMSSDAMELQLDFWMIGGNTEDREKERDKERKKSDIVRPKDLPSAKTSIKAAFRSIYVVRPVQSGNVFTLTYATKEKKIQIMRALGKKAKDVEVRTVVIDGVSRLICRITKGHGTGMKVVIDGCDWQNINFFQLSPQWHSSVKSLPVLICKRD